ncbi:MAG: HlyC/CorC family transporter [Verrucomicrobia bacterium]|nr:HlyC/CorC family transporter [Verrucomicrobiota bacterium]
MTAGLLAVLLVAIAALIVCSALFSSLETALFALRQHELRRLESNHPALARFIGEFRANPRRVLGLILLGSTFVNVFLVVLCLAVLWEGPHSALPQWLIGLVVFAVIVLVCDLIPKLLAVSLPYRLSALGVFTLRALMPFLATIGSALETISVAIVTLVTPSPVRAQSHWSDEELETLIEIGEEQGTLREAEGEMIQEVFKLGDKTAHDVLTPRVDMFALPDDLTNDDAIALLKARRHRRVPVYADSADNILGIIEVKSFLLHPDEHYTEALLPPSFVPDTMRALDLLRSFLTRPQGMAIVLDEFGGTAGIVTLSDIVEDLISDAAPLGDADLYIEPVDTGRFLVNGKARLDDLSERLGFDLEADGIDTIGGYVFTQLGYLPTPGAELETPRLKITVRRVARRRIEELLLEKTVCVACENGNGEVKW